MIGLFLGFVSGYFLGKKHEREKHEESKKACCHHYASYSEYTRLLNESRKLRREACKLRKEATRARAHPPYNQEPPNAGGECDE